MNKYNKKDKGILKRVVQSLRFQKVLVCIVAVLVIFIAVSNAAAPKKYKLTMGNPSPFDIDATRDIENTMKTQQNAENEAELLEPIVKRKEAISTEVLNNAYSFFAEVQKARNTIDVNLQSTSDGTSDSITVKVAEQEGDAIDFDKEIQEYLEKSSSINTIIKKVFGKNTEILRYLFISAQEDELEAIKEDITKKLLPSMLQHDITNENISEKSLEVSAYFEEALYDEQLKEIGIGLVNEILKPNSFIDYEETANNKQKFIEDYKVKHPVNIRKGQRIISKEDIVTLDVLDVLERSNRLDTGKVDALFYLAVFVLIILLSVGFIIYIQLMCQKHLKNISDILLVASIVLLVIITASIMHRLDISSLLIPIFIAPVLIAIFMDVRLAVIINIYISVCISFFIGMDLGFFFVSLIAGNFAAYMAAIANQRRKISVSGILIGVIGALVILTVGLLQKEDLTIVLRSAVSILLNGVFSVIISIGLLPIAESIFNIITPFKLLELADPNQPLIRRLLMEAPGTYHHSLMVGNLSEVAVRAIGGNALLARVGAYFHDVGKLKRPGFFKENQLSDNPHERITPNLSTLVITSHTKDGEELAIENKVPAVIRDIIVQHHGTTLVAYFYHKAINTDKGEDVELNNFRYEGPKPKTNEAAVVMLADSVEAAVRSMPDKTEGKIEGLVRKIIKDKLDDGQLDECNLTLRDLDEIAKSFLKVLGGFFHQRTEYPEVKVRKDLDQLDNYAYNSSGAGKEVVKAKGDKQSTENKDAKEKKGKSGKIESKDNKDNNENKESMEIKDDGK